MRSLELCSGYGSFSTIASREFGYDTVTIENDPYFKPDICCDVRQWDYRSMYKPGDIQFIWASPPCTHFSNSKRFGTRDLALADSIVLRCLEIIDYYQCAYVLENPYSGMLRHRPYMISRPYHRVDYCAYQPELGMKKSTALFTNLISFEPKTCPGREKCPGMDGASHRCTATGNYFPWRSKKQRSRELARVPANLIRSILRHPSSQIAPHD